MDSCGRVRFAAVASGQSGGETSAAWAQPGRGRREMRPLYVAAKRVFAKRRMKGRACGRQASCGRIARQLGGDAICNATRPTRE
ncbi:conserved hypothetical protein [Burkholderia multivorans CGD2]|uniref:Uncharacterized protein n=1 Tax=Burkholderia multivorans CGD2 TaxID=513052 RepID=B9BVR4_9BURK|nr:conserved hypothetical protein [Burkholderia multivorans CGD2]